MMQPCVGIPFEEAWVQFGQWMADNGHTSEHYGLTIGQSKPSLYLRAYRAPIESESLAKYVATPERMELTWPSGRGHDTTVVTINPDCKTNGMLSTLQEWWLSPITRARVTVFNQKLHDAGMGL